MWEGCAEARARPILLRYPSSTVGRAASLAMPKLGSSCVAIAEEKISWTFFGLVSSGEPHLEAL